MAMGTLSGKRAFVTGASRGIGAAVAQRLSAEGAWLGLASRSGDDLGLPDTIGLKCDVSEAGQVNAAVALAVQELDGLDILVNNAGVGAYGELTDLSLEQIDEMLDSNARGTVYSVRAALPAVLDEGGGDLVVVASVAGLRGLPNESVYCASKHAQVGFAEALDHELRPKGVRVTAICPGGVATEFAFGAGREPGMPALEDMMSSEQVAEAIVFTLRQDPGLRTLRLVMRPMSEPV